MFSDIFDMIALAYLGIGVGGAIMIAMFPFISWCEKIEELCGIDATIITLFLFNAMFMISVAAIDLWEKERKRKALDSKKNLGEKRL